MRADAGRGNNSSSSGGNAGNNNSSSSTDWDRAWTRYQKVRSGGSRATTRTVVPDRIGLDPAARQVGVCVLAA